MFWLTDSACNDLQIEKTTFLKQELIQYNLSCPTQSHLIHIYLQILCSINDIICLSVFIDNENYCKLCVSTFRECRWNGEIYLAERKRRERKCVCLSSRFSISLKNAEISWFSEDSKWNHTNKMTLNHFLSLNFIYVRLLKKSKKFWKSIIPVVMLFSWTTFLARSNNGTRNFLYVWN